jgi:phosphate acetyltransferase
VSIVSSVFLMLLPDRVLVYGDCAVNPNPTPSSWPTSRSAPRRPRRSSDRPLGSRCCRTRPGQWQGSGRRGVREATELVRERRPDLEVDGPIQYDAAVDVASVRPSCPGSSVAGRATVFIFPDLNTGNNTYKAVQRSSGAIAIGPVLQGLNKPVNDLSRGCLVDDIVNTVTITAVQAQED